MLHADVEDDDDKEEVVEEDNGEGDRFCPSRERGERAGVDTKGEKDGWRKENHSSNLWHPFKRCSAVSNTGRGSFSSASLITFNAMEGSCTSRTSRSTVVHTEGERNKRDFAEVKAGEEIKTVARERISEGTVAASKRS